MICITMIITVHHRDFSYLAPSQKLYGYFTSFAAKLYISQWGSYSCDCIWFKSLWQNVVHNEHLWYFCCTLNLTSAPGMSSCVPSFKGEINILFCRWYFPFWGKSVFLLSHKNFVVLSHGFICRWHWNKIAPGRVSTNRVPPTRNRTLVKLMTAMFYTMSMACNYKIFYEVQYNCCQKLYPHVMFMFASMSTSVPKFKIVLLCVH